MNLVGRFSGIQKTLETWHKGFPEALEAGRMYHRWIAVRDSLSVVVLRGSLLTLRCGRGHDNIRNTE